MLPSTTTSAAGLSGPGGTGASKVGGAFARLANTRRRAPVREGARKSFAMATTSPPMAGGGYGGV